MRYRNPSPKLDKSSSHVLSINQRQSGAQETPSAVNVAGIGCTTVQMFGDNLSDQLVSLIDNLSDWDQSVFDDNNPYAWDQSRFDDSNHSDWAQSSTSLFPDLRTLTWEGSARCLETQLWVKKHDYPAMFSMLESSLWTLTIRHLLLPMLHFWQARMPQTANWTIQLLEQNFNPLGRKSMCLVMSSRLSGQLCLYRLRLHTT